MKYPKMSQARLKMLHEPGHLYFAYSRYCDWIKMGFTSKQLAERLEGINRQYDEFGPFTLIGAVPSTWAAEQQLHRCFAPFRGRRTGLTKELYPALPPLMQNLKMILTYREWERMSWGRAYQLEMYARRAAEQPLNRVEVRISYERFDAERRVA